MNRRSRAAFLALILAQACHSIEEYRARLYDVFAPAHFVSGFFSDNHRIGFVIFNVSLVAFGLWCYFGPVCHASRAASALAWFWAVLELLNGLAHVAWAIAARAYRPGLATAPLLVLMALVLAWQCRHSPSATRARIHHV
ncbi:MAG: HXXEE domain-containing protein [Acidobacteriota bacterium]